MNLEAAAYRTEDPRYLRNQSRQAHIRYRRSKRSTRWSIIAWEILVGLTTAFALFDVLRGGKLGHEWKDVGGLLLMMIGGLVVWAFQCLINDVNLAISRRRYGQEPEGPIES